MNMDTGSSFEIILGSLIFLVATVVPAWIFYEYRKTKRETRSLANKAYRQAQDNGEFRLDKRLVNYFVKRKEERRLQKGYDLEERNSAYYLIKKAAH